MHYIEGMSTAHQLTIRGVDEATKKRLSARARKKGMSLNAYNLEVLRYAAGTSAVKKTNGLERFIGILEDEWDPEIDDVLKDQRRVDQRPDKIDRFLSNLE
jgi:hypothetical protein